MAIICTVYSIQQPKLQQISLNNKINMKYKFEARIKKTDNAYSIMEKISYQSQFSYNLLM